MIKINDNHNTKTMQIVIITSGTKMLDINLIHISLLQDEIPCSKIEKNRS